MRTKKRKSTKHKAPTKKLTIADLKKAIGSTELIDESTRYEVEAYGGRRSEGEL